jgi:hypothetical protein
MLMLGSVDWTICLYVVSWYPKVVVHCKSIEFKRGMELLLEQPAIDLSAL